MADQFEDPAPAADAMMPGDDAAAPLERSALPALERSLARATWSDRHASARQLTAAWERLASRPPEWDAPFALGRVFARMGFWRRAGELFRASLRRDPEHPAAWHNLAMSHWQLGELDAAELALGEARRRAPASAPIERASADIADYRLQVRSLFPWGEDGAREPGDGGVALQLTTPCHAEGLFYHQRGGTIAVAAGLPRFDSASAVRTWIERDLAAGGRIPLTLIHPLYGPVGAAGLRLDARRALVHYWVGEALQEQGLGRRVVSLLLVLARSLGLRTLYASAYRDNVRSLRVLTGRGFQRLPYALTNRPLPQEVLGHGLDGADGGDALRAFPQLCAALNLTFTTNTGGGERPTGAIGP